MVSSTRVTCSRLWGDHLGACYLCSSNGSRLLIGCLLCLLCMNLFLKCFVYFCYHCSLLYIKLPFFRKPCGVAVLLSCPGIQGVQFLRPRSPLKDTCVYFQHLDCWTVIGAEKHPHHCGFIAPLHPYVFSSFFFTLSSSSSLFPYFSPSSSYFHLGLLFLPLLFLLFILFYHLLSFPPPL